MNLLSLIVIFLAVVICGAIAFIAWELTADAGDQGDRASVEERPLDDSAGKPDKD